jgi:biotin transport system substrate-specific component
MGHFGQNSPMSTLSQSLAFQLKIDSRAKTIALVMTGTLFIALMAQVAIRLPFTPVPVTGQTLAVLLTVAVLGSMKAIASTSLYLGLAVAGFPVLAPQTDGSHITGVQVLAMPTLGYVVGFIVAAAIIGKLADLGYTKKLLPALALMVLGNVIIYALGFSTLKILLDTTWANAFAWGVAPFIVGDIFKIAVAAASLRGAWYAVNRFKSL